MLLQWHSSVMCSHCFNFLPSIDSDIILIFLCLFVCLLFYLGSHEAFLSSHKTWSLPCKLLFQPWHANGVSQLSFFIQRQLEKISLNSLLHSRYFSVPWVLIWTISRSTWNAVYLVHGNCAVSIYYHIEDFNSRRSQCGLLAHITILC